MESEKDSKKKIGIALCALTIIGIFVSLYFFFAYKHPMYVYDTDDWYYISRVRMGIPIPGAWNPNRVLPEVLMPLVAELGIDFIMPITGDYLGSIATASAVILSLLITVYIALFVRVMGKENKINKGIGIFMLPTLLLIHFLPFFTEFFSYSHMFTDHDLTCVFYYTISALVNSSLVLFLWNKERIAWENKKKIAGAALLLLWIYVCIFSNVFQSIILASFMAMKIFESIIDKIISKEIVKEKKFNLLGIIKDNFDRIIVVCVWLLSLLLETKGGRSDSLQFSFILKESFMNYLAVIKNLNRLFLLFILGSLCLALVIYIISNVIRKKKVEKEVIESGNRYIRNVLRICVCYVLTTAFLIILCGKVNIDYLFRPSVSFGSIFFLILLAVISLGYTLERIPYVGLIIPIAVFILVSEVVVTKHNYKDIYEPQKSKAVGEDIVNQVLEAEEAGLSYVEVYIPNEGSVYWPFDLQSGGAKIANTLYNNGITRTQMDIQLIPR